MSNPAINPTTVGATTYQIAGTPRVFAEFVFNIPISAPFPTFDLICPADAEDMEILLVRDSVRLDLLGQIYTDYPAFANRLISTKLFTEENQQTLTCEIKASASADTTDHLQLLIKAGRNQTYHLTQLENNPLSPTIKNIICIQPARIETDGDVIITDTGWKVHEKGVVTLKVIDGIGIQLENQEGTTPFPLLKYRWKHNSPLNIPEFAEANKIQTISFWAPPVKEPLNIIFEAEFIFEEGFPPFPELFGKGASISLQIEPLAATLKIEKEYLIADKYFSGYFSQFLSDRQHGILAVSVSAGEVAQDEKQVCVARLDQYQPKTGFNSPATAITVSFGHENPHATVLPNGELAATFTVNSEDSQAAQFKYGSLAELKDTPAQNLAENLQGFQKNYIVYANGTLFVFYYHLGWFFRRFSLQEGWLDEHPIKVLEDKYSSFQAIVDEKENSLWLASNTDWDFVHPQNNSNISCKIIKLSLETGQKIMEENRQEHIQGNPSIVLKNSRDVWFFWGGGFDGMSNLVCWRCQDGNWKKEISLPDELHFNPDKPSGIGWGRNHSPHTALDSGGGIWLFWTHDNLVLIDKPGQPLIYFSRRNPETDLWSKPQKLSVGHLSEIIVAKYDTIWAFGYKEVLIGDDFSHIKEKAIEQFYRRMFTKL